MFSVLVSAAFGAAAGFTSGFTAGFASAFGAAAGFCAGLDRNLFEMSEEELKEAGVEKLPMNLMEACQEFEKDEYIKNVLGNDLVQKYTQAKKKEYEEYVTQVTEWELNKYLHRI